MNHTPAPALVFLAPEPPDLTASTPIPRREEARAMHFLDPAAGQALLDFRPRWIAA